EAPLPVEEVTLDAAGGDAAQQLYARFDPRSYRIDLRTAPLVRVSIARDETRDRWLLMLLLHHLAGDHATLETIAAEVEAHVRGRAAELQEPSPLRNYAPPARLGVSAAEHEQFFRGMLSDVDEPTAPFGLLDVRGD